jgi:hypothetical protein
MQIQEYIQIVGMTTAALLGIAAVLSKFIWRPVKSIVERQIVEALDERLKPIEQCVAQLRPNGGSHLADRVIRLEERQSGIANRLDDIFDLVKSLATKEK